MNTHLFLVTWIAGLPGVAAVSLLAVPALLANRALPMPLWAAQLAIGAQSAVLLAVAAVVGVALAGKVGLATPALFGTCGSRVARRYAPATNRTRLAWRFGQRLCSLDVHALFAKIACEYASSIRNASFGTISVRRRYGGIAPSLGPHDADRLGSLAHLPKRSRHAFGHCHVAGNLCKRGRVWSWAFACCIRTNRPPFRAGGGLRHLRKCRVWSCGWLVVLAVRP
jgi:hypothetical protein